MNNPRQAVNFIRTRQERFEFRFWLSAFAYDTHDTSTTNRLYLVYLLVFLSLMTLMGLMFLSEGFTIALSFLPVAWQARAPTILSGLVLVTYTLQHLFSSFRTSPLQFSDDDRYLLCQQPVSPAWVALRWQWKEFWLPAFILFLLFTLFGFVQVELSLGADPARFFWQYLVSGLRSSAVLLPIAYSVHLIGFALGLRLRAPGDPARRWLPALLIAAALTSLVLGLAASTFVRSQAITPSILRWLPRAALGLVPLPWLPYLLTTGLLILLCLWFLWLSASRLSLSRVAEASSREYLLQDLRRYGLDQAANKLRAEWRLSRPRRTTFTPAWQGASAVVWKQIVQHWRVFTLTQAWQLLSTALLAFSLALSTPQTRLLPILGLSVLTSQFTTRPFRTNLREWQLMRQLPLGLDQIALAEVAIPTAAALSMALLGSLVAALTLPNASLSWALVSLPLVLAVSMASTALLLGRAGAEALSQGIVPSHGLVDIALAVIVGLFTMFILSWEGGTVYFAAALGCLLITWLAHSALRRAARQVMWR